MRIALVICSLTLFACGTHPLAGTWTGTTQAGSTRTLTFDNEGYVRERDTLYPEETLASLDPENPAGNKLFGTYSTEGERLIIEGYDGLFPRKWELLIHTEDSYELTDDLLAESLFAASTPGVDLVGTWQHTWAESYTSPIVGSGATEHRTTLTLSADGTASRVDEAVGEPDRTNARTGTWSRADQHVTLDLDATVNPNQPPTRFSYSLRPSGKLAQMVSTRVP